MTPRYAVTFTADEVAAAARLAGYTPTEVSERGELVDGHVQITPAIHIQVSEGLCLVGREVGDAFEFSPPFDGPDQVKAALHYVTQLLRVPCPTIYPERKTTYSDGRVVITHDVPCGGSLHWCRICGQQRYCGREAHCLDDDTPTHVVRRHFMIDNDDYGCAGGVPGWTRGEHWNGWACPRFEKEAALAILARQQEFDGRAAYDEATDTMTIWMDASEDDPDRYPGEPLETPEGLKTVYCIGAWAWIWDTVEDHQ